MKTNENERKNKFYKTNSRGISLIVLVITIIVIIILATAIIVTLLSNNPINEANKARFENDRDSMQAIFTSTVAKVMAQKQATMDIKASSLNTVTSGVSSATGDANYTLNGVVKEEEKNGRIIFDNKENTETEYYTGKQLPIYKSGETTWYVDEEGIITLQVGDKIYGEGEIEKLNKNIQIESKVTPSSDYVKATIEIEITYEGEIESITINGESIEIPEKQDGKYIISKEVTENGEYKVEVKAKDGTKNKEIVKVEELTEDMEIWNRADMEKFRDKVNKGATYYGKTVTVMDDINLGGSSNNWTPIANYVTNNNLSYKGTFEGNNKTISGLYINTSNGYQGLFGCNNGEIKNIKLSGSIVNASEITGALVGMNMKNIVNCHNNVNVQVNNAGQVGGISGQNRGTIEKCSNFNNIQAKGNAGGIAGLNTDNGSVKVCYNKSKITATNMTAGGIVGYNSSGKVYNCYNIGTINAPLYVGGINGAGGSSWGSGYTYNCYNLGTISGNTGTGNITGFPNANGGISQDINCYSTNATVAGLNRGTFSENVWKADKVPNINNGYPILNWQ